MSTADPTALDDRILRPGDPGFDEEISGFNLAINHQPELVVAAESADDVVAAVALARERGLAVNVQSTGHTDTAIEGGVLISTRHMDDFELDADAATARVGAGVRWATVVAAAAERGLAPITGSSPNVGVVGYLLGGGVGPLARSHGFSSDYLLGLTVVTGEGELVEADADHNPDLFWALRGGKVGLGIVTEVRLRLVELSALYAGALMFAEEDIERALKTWAAWTATADDQVTTSVAIMRFPPFEMVPEPLRGRNLLALRFAYPGSAEKGAELAQPLRDAAPVYIDMLGELPLNEVGRIHSDPTDPAPATVSGRLLTHIDAELADAVSGRSARARRRRSSRSRSATSARPRTPTSPRARRSAAAAPALRSASSPSTRRGLRPTSRQPARASSPQSSPGARTR